MPRKLIKIMSMMILFLMMVLMIILGIQESEFSKIKKYDKDNGGGKSFSNMVVPGRTKQKTFSSSVTIEGNSRANLGDFRFNVDEDKTLVANISLVYKSTKKDDDWFGSDDIEEELVKKSILLRDAAINTMIGNKRATIESRKIRNELKKNINENLKCGEVEEVYFNKFLIK